MMLDALIIYYYYYLIKIHLEVVVNTLDQSFYHLGVAGRPHWPKRGRPATPLAQRGGSSFLFLFFKSF
jgi:hypothetical protein